MVKTFTVILTFLLINACSNDLKLKNNNKKPGFTELKVQVDDYLQNAQQSFNIPGIALAVIKNDQIIYQNYLGYKSLEDNSKVNEDTLFRIFSATKLITTVAVFQLIERGQLNLLDPITKYLPSLPDKWGDIKVENLLTHSSGLPDLIAFKSELTDSDLLSKLYEKPLEFKLGSQFSYNQTNYWLLAQIIENISRSRFDNFVLKNQFNIDTQGVVFSSDSNQDIPNRAIRYHYNPKNKVFEKDTNNNGIRGHSGNGLNISLNEFIEWNHRLDNNLLINDLSKKLMWSTFKFSNQEDDFLHGWESYVVNGIQSVGFSGGNLAGFRKFTNDDTTIIFLSNGYQTPAYDIITNDVARMTLGQLKVKNLILEADLMGLITAGTFNQAQSSYVKLREQNPHNDFSNLKWNINGLGNQLQFIEDKKDKALKVFDFNAQVNPGWWVAMASLAEIQESLLKYNNAMESYKRAVNLNKKNEWNYNVEMNKKIDLIKEKIR